MPDVITRTAVPIVPAVFFGMVLGLGGLGSAWRAAHRIWSLPTTVGEALSLLAFAVWFGWLTLFALKWLLTPAAAQAELHHPTASFSIGLIPMATVIASLALKPYAPALSDAIAITGLLSGLAFAAWAMGTAWQGGRPVSATTPLMYLTPVGAGFLGAMAAASLGSPDLAVMLWGAGAISWLFIEAAVLQRLMSEPMPAPLRATLGIQLAPPAVGCMSYLAITPGLPDRLAQVLIGYALLQGLILLRLTPWLRQQPFGPGAWAYTFGVAALSVSLLICLERGQTGIVTWLAPLVFVVANVFIGWIAGRTAWLAANGRLFPPPEPAK